MKNVLILDSDIHFANTLKMYFRKNDYECTICTDANQTDAIIANSRFDLVISGLQVTHKSGLEMAVNLKQRLAQTNTPFILVTPGSNPVMNATFESVQADAIVHKPISFSTLLQTVNEITLARV